MGRPRHASCMVGCADQARSQARRIRYRRQAGSIKQEDADQEVRQEGEAQAKVQILGCLMALAKRPPLMEASSFLVTWSASLEPGGPNFGCRSMSGMRY